MRELSFVLPMQRDGLHIFHSVLGPLHGNPPFWIGLLAQDLERFLVPFPHVLLHAVQAPQVFHLP